MIGSMSLVAAAFRALHLKEFGAKTGPRTKRIVGKRVTRYATLPNPLTRQLFRQEQRLAAKGRRLI